jgi:hypothetical protein
LVTPLVVNSKYRCHGIAGTYGFTDPEKIPLYPWDKFHIWSMSATIVDLFIKYKRNTTLGTFYSTINKSINYYKQSNYSKKLDLIIESCFVDISKRKSVIQKKKL